MKDRSKNPSSEGRRLRIIVRGTVQGVGFRPHVYRLALAEGLAGWVANGPEGARIEVEGPERRLDSFLSRLASAAPARARIEGLERVMIDPVGTPGFSIRPSDQEGGKEAVIPPDLATCADCLRELFDPSNRRYRYPFTNCTQCGPRWSILERLPYDRAHTVMKCFRMCATCQREYQDPVDRRFHAQPNACPMCGPSLELWDADGRRLAGGDEALCKAAAALQAGRIVALKGLGGFQLLADATNDGAVRRLRERKRREEKPFAVMARDLCAAHALCEISEPEARLLDSSEAPIVLLRSHAGPAIAGSVAPGNPYLGIFLPCSPLHHLLLEEIRRPVVATSGNVAEEPICIDERIAIRQLAGIPDLLLVHNRPIARPVDDSVAWVWRDRVCLSRRARGYAPLPIATPAFPPGLVAVGGHMKNTVALSVGGRAVLSQHIGDLESPENCDAFRATLRSLSDLFETPLERVACDAHPDYASTRFAQGSGLPVEPVQHHLAHVLSCMVEHDLPPPVLGIVWDGTGWGPDGTVWGGESLRVCSEGFSRVSSFRPFRLPGGERAVREPRRAALGVLHALFGAELYQDDFRYRDCLRPFTSPELRILRTMLDTGIRSPWTTSAGRLFDAVASLLRIRHVLGFEGQAAMEIEFAVETTGSPDDRYDVRFRPFLDGNRSDFDWEPLVRGILQDAARGVPTGAIASKFHETLAEVIVRVARCAGEENVVLSGGCFQNRCLIERACTRLEADGFRVHTHQRVPPNDGGLALGQLAEAARRVGRANRAPAVPPLIPVRTPVALQAGSPPGERADGTHRS